VRSGGQIPAAGALLAGGWLAVELARGGVPWTAAFFLSLALLCFLQSREGGLKAHPDLSVFLAALAFYLSSFRWRGGDDIPASLIPLSVLRHGTLALDPVLDPWLSGKAENFVVRADGHVLSVFSVVPGLLALPVYLIPVACGAPITESFLHNLSKLSASLIVAASVAAFRRAVLKRCSGQWALVLTGFYALGSFAFSVSSQGLWEHGPAQLGLALALWGLSGSGRGHDLLSGAGLGLAVAARPESALLACASGGFLLFHQTRRLPRFLLGAALPLGLWVCYWLHYTGRLQPPEWEHHARIFQGLMPTALWALAASPTRGLVFFSPFAAFGALSLLSPRRPLAAWLLSGCLANLLLIASYAGWSGGMSFGTRTLAGIVLVLAFFCSELEERIRGSPWLLAAWSASGAFSILVHSLGAYLNWPGSFRFQEAQARAWDWSLHPVAQLFSAEGGLGALSPWLRLGLGLALILGFALLAVFIKRLLDPRKPPPCVAGAPNRRASRGGSSPGKRPGAGGARWP